MFPIRDESTGQVISKGNGPCISARIRAESWPLTAGFDVVIVGAIVTIGLRVARPRFNRFNSHLRSDFCKDSILAREVANCEHFGSIAPVSPQFMSYGFLKLPMIYVIRREEFIIGEIHAASESRNLTWTEVTDATMVVDRQRARFG
jgi:hypothetical protein